jgi:hypothetical protein
MKTPKKNSHGFYLQKRNNRWKWIAGATAATAAGVTGSQAGMVTINLVDNFISATDGNHLNADLTGDGHPDLTITGAGAGRYTFTHQSYPYIIAAAQARLNGVFAFASVSFVPSNKFERVILGSQEKGFYSGYFSLTGLIPIFFKDLHINGGAQTAGSLEVTVSSQARFDGNPKIQLDSLTYNASNLPDQGSSLALLAMGAGGILALRRWRTGQKTS